MPYSPQDLKQIREAERAIWEMAYEGFAGKLHRLSGGWDSDSGLMSYHIADEADKAVWLWRKRFCPQRNGSPLEPCWDYTA